MTKRKRDEISTEIAGKVNLDSKEILDDRFKIIVGEPNFEINRFGQIRNRQMRTLRLHSYCDGYRAIRLQTGGKHHFVHRLVAKAFIPNRDPKRDQVNHKNKDRADCRVENLEWVDRTTNIKHATQHITSEMRSESAKYRKRPVQQLDKTTGEIIARFAGLREAENAIGTSKNTIWKAIQNKDGSAGGYRWVFDDESKAIKPNAIIPGENWRSIPDSNNLYEVSDLGRVRNQKTKLILNQHVQHNYYVANILRKTFYVHRLVATAFLPPPKCDGLVVNHKDENRKNNIPSNLEWLTAQENTAYSLGHKVHRIDPKTLAITETFTSVNKAAKDCGISHGKLAWAIKKFTIESESKSLWKLAE